MLPKPTAEAAADNTKASLPDHVARDFVVSDMRFLPPRIRRAGTWHARVLSSIEMNWTLARGVAWGQKT